MSAMENAHAVVIGIANYLNTNYYLRKLPPTVLQDAQDIYNLLINPQYCGYPLDNVKRLLDDQATQAGIRQALADLAQNTNQDSSVFFYISSHGGRIESGQYAGEYLYPVDADFPPEEKMAETAISGAEFTKMLQDIPARKVVVVLDCCHSGGIGELKGVAAPNVKAGFSEKYYDALQAGQGRVILASSSDNEESNIMPGDEHSLFTKHFIAGIQGGIASDDGMIRIFNLFEYVQPLVTSECPDQNPVFYSKIKDNFPIALYLGGKKGVIPKDAEGFRFDAYISYVNKEPDATWVRETLLPRLKEANLRIAISGRVGEPGVARVVNIERGVSQAKRTILVLSKNYLAAHWATFESVLAQTMGINAGTYPLLPVEIEPLDDGQLPMSLSMLTPLNLVDPDWAEEDFERLIAALQGPLPRM